jgi:hypothetical protein
MAKRAHQKNDYAKMLSLLSIAHVRKIWHIRARIYETLLTKKKYSAAVTVSSIRYTLRHIFIFIFQRRRLFWAYVFLW